MKSWSYEQFSSFKNPARISRQPSAKVAFPALLLLGSVGFQYVLLMLDPSNHSNWNGIVVLEYNFFVQASNYHIYIYREREKGFINK